LQLHNLFFSENIQLQELRQLHLAEARLALGAGLAPLVVFGIEKDRPFPARRTAESSFFVWTCTAIASAGQYEGNRTSNAGVFGKCG
jgi:hypothetical protein